MEEKVWCIPTDVVVVGGGGGGSPTLCVHFCAEACISIIQPSDYYSICEEKEERQMVTGP
jgi:hypothetical protein